MAALLACKSCNGPLGRQAKACPNCGQPRGGTTPLRVICITFITLFVILLLGSLGR